jgi:MSHA biogenesis protein MshM
MRQLRQRIGFSCTLSPMSVTATADYIAHRIRVADCRSRLRFNESAVRQVCKASEGAPRLINILCHKALMVAYGRGEYTITGAHIARAVADTESAIQPLSWRSPIAAMRAKFLTDHSKSVDLDVLHGARR